MGEEKARVDSKQIADFEQQEAAYWGDYYQNVDPETADKLGIRILKAGEAIAGAAANIDILAFNRVIGLGLEQPITESQLDEIIDFYKDAEVPRFFLQVSPAAKPDNLPELLQTKGFENYNNWVKWFREIKPVPVSDSELRIEQIAQADADKFGEIISTAFEWPQILNPMLKVVVGRPGWKHYLVCDEETVAGCGALFVRGEYATLAFAATLPEYRGKGAQSALISRRFKDAAESGCRWMITETAEETPEHPVASSRNMRRHGFEIAYKRPNHILYL